MSNNNKKHLQYLLISFYLLLHTVTSTTNPKHSVKAQDLKNITLNRHQNGFELSININHNALNLKAQLNNGRTWIKEALCKQCSIDSEECKSSCFGQKQSSRISCDSSFCSKLGDYSDQIFGIEGVQAEMFLKLGNDTQILMPLVLANKLYQDHNQSGRFSVFDSQASFDHGILARNSASSLQLYNCNNMAEQVGKQLRQKQGDPIVFQVTNSDFNMQFLRASRVMLHDVDNQTNIFTEQMQQSNILFSLESSYLTLPIRLIKKIQKFLSQNYLPNKKCKFLPKRIKCAHQIQAKQLFRIIIHIQINKNILAIPLHMLFTSCSKNQCTTLINYSQNAENIITIGYCIFQLYNLEYKLQKREISLHRKNTQWDQLFDKDKYQLTRISFLYGIWLIIYHTIRYFLLFAFYMSIFAIIINCIVNWKKILYWIRGLLLKRKNRGSIEEQEYYQQDNFRKISSRPSLEDDPEFI